MCLNCFVTYVGESYPSRFFPKLLVSEKSARQSKKDMSIHRKSYFAKSF
jgi:hypothetical protein